MPGSVLYKGFRLLPVPRHCRPGAWSVEVQVSIPGDPRASAVIWGPDRTCPNAELAASEGLAFAQAAIDQRYPAN
jgi:hypothetical protein